MRRSSKQSAVRGVGLWTAALVLACGCQCGPVSKSEVSGDITASTTWSLSICPITVVSDVYVQGPGAPKLTIEPGCEVRFREGAGIYVAYNGEPGALSAVGTAQKPILFTAAGEKKPGAWAAIGFYDQTVDAQSRLAYVTAEFGGGPEQGSLELTDAVPTIEHSTFRSSSTNGIFARGTGGFAAASTDITASSNGRFGISIAGAQAHTVPEAGSYGGNTAGAVEVADSGNISSSVTWGAIGAPYVVTADLYVQGPQSPVLTIAEGASLAFAAGRGIWVAYNGEPGALAVRGSPQAPVVFTANEEKKKGAWGGIGFWDQTVEASTSLENAVIEYAGAGMEACLSAREAAVVLRNVTVRECKNHGISLEAGASLGEQSTGITAISNELSGIALLPEAARTVPSASSSYTQNPAGGVLIKEGKVVTSGTWRKLDVPYVVSGDVYVEGNSGPVLSIEAGTELQFKEGASLSVAYNGEPGGLKAQGTPAAPIVFTAHGQPSKGRWYGLGFYDQSIDGQCLLEHAVVEWAGGSAAGSILVRDARPAIRNSKIWRGASCGIDVQCYLPANGPEVSGVDYGSGVDANEGGTLCSSGC